MRSSVIKLAATHFLWLRGIKCHWILKFSQVPRSWARKGVVNSPLPLKGTSRGLPPIHNHICDMTKLLGNICRLPVIKPKGNVSKLQIYYFWINCVNLVILTPKHRTEKYPGFLISELEDNCSLFYSYLVFFGLRLLCCILAYSQFCCIYVYSYLAYFKTSSASVKSSALKRKILKYEIRFCILFGERWCLD